MADVSLEVGHQRSTLLDTALGGIFILFRNMCANSEFLVVIMRLVVDVFITENPRVIKLKTVRTGTGPWRQEFKFIHSSFS